MKLSTPYSFAQVEPKPKKSEDEDVLVIKVSKLTIEYSPDTDREQLHSVKNVVFELCGNAPEVTIKSGDTYFSARYQFNP
jgi:hypothetical protein